MRQRTTFPLAGGLNMQASPLLAQPGEMFDCLNLYCHKEGGYARIKGYERFDGHDSPSGAGQNKATIETFRAVIQQVPGSGPVRGVVIYKNKVYAFRNTIDGLSCAMYESSPAGWVQKKTGLPAGGAYRFDIANFSGAAGQEKLFGVSGISKGFSWDGSTWIDISTGMASDKPSHVCAHRNHLFYGFDGGSLQHSGIGDPYTWTLRSGAADIGLSDSPTALISHNQVLVAYARNSTHVLYGNSSADWALKTNTKAGGSIDNCAAVIGGDVISVDDSGISLLSATQNYGDFSSVGITAKIAPAVSTLLNAKCITINRNDWTVRIFVGQECYILTMSGSTPLGYGFANYPGTECVTSGEIDGQIRTFIGGENGFVYELDKGSSADGSPIQSYFSLVYGNLGLPRQQSRIYSAAIDVFSKEQTEFQVAANFNYGESGSDQVPTTVPAMNIKRIDVDEIDTFPLDATPQQQTLTAHLYGVGSSVSLTFSNESDTVEEYIASAAHIQFTPRRQER